MIAISSQRRPMLFIATFSTQRWTWPRTMRSTIANHRTSRHLWNDQIRPSLVVTFRCQQNPVSTTTNPPATETWKQETEWWQDSCRPPNKNQIHAIVWFTPDHQSHRLQNNNSKEFVFLQSNSLELFPLRYCRLVVWEPKANAHHLLAFVTSWEVSDRM